jgi:hypothetical protein
MSKISPGMSAISSHIGLVPLNLAKIPEPATTGGFSGQPVNWSTNLDLIAQTVVHDTLHFLVHPRAYEYNEFSGQCIVHHRGVHYTFQHQSCS